MTREEVSEIINIIVTAYPGHEKFNNESYIQGMVSVWLTAFIEADADRVMQAVSEHITLSEQPPSIAEIKARMSRFAPQDEGVPLNAIIMRCELESALLIDEELTGGIDTLLTQRGGAHGRHRRCFKPSRYRGRPHMKRPASAPWERQEDESPQAFEAFFSYRDLGAERSLQTVGKRLGKSSTLICRWSSRHAWGERAWAYDNYLDRQAQKTAIRALKRMRKMQISEGCLMQQRGLDALCDIPIEDIDAKAVIRLIAEGAKLEQENRLALAGPIVRTNPAACSMPEIHAEDGPDGSKLSDATLARLAGMAEADEPDKR